MARDGKADKADQDTDTAQSAMDAQEIELLRDGIAGTIPLDDLPAHIRDRIRLRQHGISVSPFTAFGTRIA